MSSFSEGTWCSEKNKITADGKLIAVFAEFDEDYESITEVNARLIEEAPRMYYMLKTCAELVGEDSGKRIKLMFDYIDVKNIDYSFRHCWKDE